MNLIYIDENGNHIDGEFLYETRINNNYYALCNLHYGFNNNTVCVCKIIKDDNNKFIALDNNDDLETIMNQFNKLLMEAE